MKRPGIKNRDNFSWEKEPTITTLGCKILKVLLSEGYPLNQSYLSKKTASTISGVSKCLQDLEFLGLVVQMNYSVKAYILNPYRKEETKKFITGYDFGKNHPLILSGHASVYWAEVKGVSDRLLNHLKKNEKFIHSQPKNWDSYCKRVSDGTIEFHKTVHHCRIYFSVKTFGLSAKIIEMVNKEKVIGLIKKLEESYPELRIGDFDILAKCRWQEYAIQKDPISVLGIQLGIKHKNIEQSSGYPEWEQKGISACEAVQRIISLREFCVENEIDELELNEVKQEILELIRKLRENKVKIDKQGTALSI